MTEKVKRFLVKKYSKKLHSLPSFGFGAKVHPHSRLTNQKGRAGLRFGFAGQPGTAISLKNFMFSSLCYLFEVFKKTPAGLFQPLRPREGGFLSSPGSSPRRCGIPVGFCARFLFIIYKLQVPRHRPGSSQVLRQPVRTWAAARWAARPGWLRAPVVSGVMAGSTSI